MATSLRPPRAERELRGVWVATVGNIDWPSRAGLSTADQQRELVALFDRATALHFNAVILQVRPAADALYASSLEPWSEYLTGRQGLAPEPFYDPLAFAIDEAHKRGLELHAWFNPYRARHPSSKSPAAASHISRRHAELVHAYGRNQLWMDPGEPAVRRHSLRVVLDVVQRYDVDGVHIDDYFYPYPEPGPGGDLPFPDGRSWRRYRRRGGHLPRDAWRRANVDDFVRELYAEVKHAKPWVRVGISPFGIWRPGFPASVRGFDAFTRLFADSRRWLTEGWLDYVAPQLYWPIAAREQGYTQLLEWWSSQNVKSRHVYAGNYAGRVANDGKGWRAQELLNQIDITRVTRGASGNVYFSMAAFLTSRDSLVERLMRGAYATQALVPPSPWLPAEPLAPPVAAATFDAATSVTTVALAAGRPIGDSVTASGTRRHRTRGSSKFGSTWVPSPSTVPWLWVVRARFDSSWTTAIVPGRESSYAVLSPVPSPPESIAVSAVDRLGNESALVFIVPSVPAPAPVSSPYPATTTVPLRTPPRVASTYPWR
ncbi:MAG: hypothetical protein NVS4B3_05450 [Gemmatimonadaceae bacterium]